MSPKQGDGDCVGGDGFNSSMWRTGKLDVSDIAGAKPKSLPPARRVPLPDVEGAKPKRHHLPRHTSSTLSQMSLDDRHAVGGIAVAGNNMKLRLDVSDVNGACPSAIGPFVTDPSTLKPKHWQRPYKVPGEKEREEMEERAREELKRKTELGPGKRPTNDISDIDKSRRMLSKVELSKTRNTQFSTDDIEESKPHALPKPRTGVHDKVSTAYDVHDIVDEGKGFQTKRSANPLDPTYVIGPSFCAKGKNYYSNAYKAVFGGEDDKYEVGRVPKKFLTNHVDRKLESGEPLKKSSYALQTRDIAGAYSEYKHEQRMERGFSDEPTSIERLDESMRGGSKHLTTFTKRANPRGTNPLQPSYPWPAYREEEEKKKEKDRRRKEEDIEPFLLKRSQFISEQKSVGVMHDNSSEDGKTRPARPLSAPTVASEGSGQVENDEKLGGQGESGGGTDVNVIEEREGARRLAEHLQQRMRNAGYSLLDAFRSLGGGKEAPVLPTASQGRAKSASAVAPHQVKGGLLAYERERRRWVGGHSDDEMEGGGGEGGSNMGKARSELLQPSTIQRFLRQNYSIYAPQAVVERLARSISSSNDGSLRMADISRLLDRSWAPSRDQRRAWVSEAKASMNGGGGANGRPPSQPGSRKASKGEVEGLQAGGSGGGAGGGSGSRRSSAGSAAAAPLRSGSASASGSRRASSSSGGGKSAAEVRQKREKAAEVEAVRNLPSL
eukprot:CAMPEP_0113880408 /NCGR_PEP_ID=MMETSP0780_2-20120614/7769_1 /TAXON_ID=652834 /ORGANISM="Palpitomonas bilix" /LENGTH=721 /DNA_ID=CAMNT_0000867081 /DNA_START=366 /DNA_END=2531 /DNA_ORIENTATION=+ /assembly_acc=CAM_ASM_000599